MSEIITLQEILDKYNVHADNLSFEGSGAFGEAYSFEAYGERYVIKFTNRKQEFDCSILLKEKQSNTKQPLEDTIYHHSAIIYELGSFTDSGKIFKYYTIMEYINMDEYLSSLFQNYIDTNSEYVEYTEEDKMYSVEEEDAFILMFRIQESIGANDLHANNIGYGNDGTIKGFDWDRTK